MDSKTQERTLSPEKLIGPIEVTGLISSSITIGGFITQASNTLNISSEYMILLVGITGIIWIASILKKLTVAVTELKRLRQDIKNIQHLNIYIDGEGNVLKVDQKGEASADQSQGKTTFEEEINTGGGDLNIQSQVDKSQKKVLRSGKDSINIQTNGDLKVGN